MEILGVNLRWLSKKYQEHTENNIPAVLNIRVTSTYSFYNVANLLIFITFKITIINVIFWCVISIRQANRSIRQ